MKVLFGEEARRDLEELFVWIATEAGVAVADRYIARLQAFCLGFDVFPSRGTPRDDLSPGLRLVGFERRVTLAFLVTEDAVVFTRVLYGGRDLDGITSWDLNEEEAVFAAD